MTVTMIEVKRLYKNEHVRCWDLPTRNRTTKTAKIHTHAHTTRKLHVDPLTHNPHVPGRRASAFVQPQEVRHEEALDKLAAKQKSAYSQNPRHDIGASTIIGNARLSRALTKSLSMDASPKGSPPLFCANSSLIHCHTRSPPTP